MPLVVSPSERLLQQFRAEPGAAVPDLEEAQRQAGVLVVDAKEFVAMSHRALPQFGKNDSTMDGETNTPIFDALTAELGTVMQAPA